MVETVVIDTNRETVCPTSVVTVAIGSCCSSMVLTYQLPQSAIHTPREPVVKNCQPSIETVVKVDLTHKKNYHDDRSDQQNLRVIFFCQEVVAAHVESRKK